MHKYQHQPMPLAAHMLRVLLRRTALYMLSARSWWRFSCTYARTT